MKTKPNQLARCEAIASQAVNWQEALNKLRGHDLIYAVSAVRKQFAVSNEQIIAWIETP